MKIAFLLNNLVSEGGVARVVINLAKILKEQGHDIKILCSNYNSNFARSYGIKENEIISNKKLKFFDKMKSIPIIGYTSQVLKFFLLGFLLSIKLLKTRPTIINSHYYLCGLSGWILSKIMRVPHVLTIHGVPLSKTNMKTLHYWVDFCIIHFLKNHISYFISVDPTLNTSIQFQEISERLKIIFPCIDSRYLELVQNIKPKQRISDGLKLIYMGRIEKQKGLEELIVKIAQNKSYWSKIKIVGKGKYITKLKKIVNKTGISDKVFFLGFLDGMEKIQAMNDSDILISYSRSEGFPLVILEFFALGKPCMIYPVGGISNFAKKFEGEKFGIFLKLRQNFLKEVLQPAYISDFFSQSRCDARKEFILDFTPEKIAMQYFEYFKEILGERKNKK